MLSGLGSILYLFTAYSASVLILTRLAFWRHSFSYQQIFLLRRLEYHAYRADAIVFAGGPYVVLSKKMSAFDL